jgi:L-rhamnose-H+ transport protein
MSACFAFGLAAATDIGPATVAAGTRPLFSGLPKLPVVLLGGWLTNALWCVGLGWRNGTSYEYTATRVRGVLDNSLVAVETTDNAMATAAAPPPTADSSGGTGGGIKPVAGGEIPLLANYFWCAVAGLTWYFQFFFYTMGESQMGKFGFASWTLHMSSIIIFSTLWGLGLGEWAGASEKSMRLLRFGVGALVGSTLVIGLGAWLKSQ